MTITEYALLIVGAALGFLLRPYFDRLVGWVRRVKERVSKKE